MPFVAPKKHTKNIPSFRWGLNDQQESDEVNDVELVDCENFTIDEDSVSLAPGYYQRDLTPEAGPIWGIYQFVKSDGTRRLIRQIGNKLQYDLTGLGAWTDCTLPTTGSPASTITLTEKQPTFATLNDTLLWGNGVEDVMSSADGTSWTLRPTLPKASIIVNNGKNRILFMGITDAPSIIWWSDINQPLTVKDSAWQYIDPNNGEIIIGHALDPLGNNFIFKTNSYYSIADFVESGFIDVNFRGKFKVASHHAIKATENSIIAAGVDGIYEYFGGAMNKISGRIKQTGRNDITRPDLMTAVYIGNKYYLSMPDDANPTYNSQEYVVHRTVGRSDPTQPYAITRNKRYWGCYCIEEKASGSDREFVLLAGESVNTTSGSPATSSAKVHIINYLKNLGVTQGLNGSDQSAYFITKFFTDDVPFYAKRFKKLFVSLKSANDFSITLGYRFSPSGAFTEMSDSFTGGDIDILYEDGNSGDFLEGYNFASSERGLFEKFFSLENVGRPRGVQFKISISEINDVSVLGLAYQTRIKNKFK